LPFLPGDALKSTAVTLLVPTLWKFVPKNDKQ
jgi:bioY family protein